jgi:hypothetical protein
MTIAPAPNRLTERERARLNATRPFLTPLCENGRDHRMCGGTVALGISCECVCHAMAVNGQASRP